MKALTRLERITVIEMFKALWQLQISPAVILINYTVWRTVYLLSVNLMFVDPCIIVQFIQKSATRCNSVSKFIPYLYEAQHVSGDTPPITRNLKLQ